MIADDRHHLSLFDMIPDLRFCAQHPIDRRAQDPTRIPFWLAGIRLCGTFPVHAPHRMATTGLDHGVAVHAGVEARSEPDVERDVYRERLGRGLEQTRVDHYRKVKSGK